jgi:branched-chain amino acid transport system permease protein
MILCMVVLGGMGHIPGVILGCIVLTVLPEAFRYGAGPIQNLLFGKVLVDPEALRMMLFGLTLVVVMLYRPAGLWPEPRRRQEMAKQ